MVPALSGLALTLVGAEPAQARALAWRAVSYGPVLGHIGALLALGRVEAARGDRERAHDVAVRAERVARARRDRAGLAEAIELAVRTSVDPVAERIRLEEAISLWRDIGSPLGEARAELAIAELLEPADARPIAARARERLLAIGARGDVAAADALLGRSDQAAPAEVEIRILGGFEVLRHGRAVPIAEWGSRKARDLIRYLVAARGTAIPREVLLESLWPGDPPERSGPRLSVALSTARGILDPGKAWPADHYLAADRQSVRLRVDHLAVDLLEFEREARRGLARAPRDADPTEAWAALVRAEAVYRGDPSADEAYDDDLSASREAARSLYTQVARTLGRLATRDGRPDLAASYLRRVLEHDPFDEAAHLDLVGVLTQGGHHGAARRAYRAYVARMDELGVEAAPFGATSGAGDGPP
jgi:DNA-binding SARP family transcriptional activator